MTVPTERTEAILRTRKFLLNLADPKVTPRILRRLRQQALSLLKHFPTEADLSKAAQAVPGTFGPVSTAMFETASALGADQVAPVDGIGSPKENK